MLTDCVIRDFLQLARPIEFVSLLTIVEEVATTTMRMCGQSSTILSKA